MHRSKSNPIRFPPLAVLTAAYCVSVAATRRGVPPTAILQENNTIRIFDPAVVIADLEHERRRTKSEGTKGRQGAPPLQIKDSTRSSVLGFTTLSRVWRDGRGDGGVAWGWRSRGAVRRGEEGDHHDSSQGSTNIKHYIKAQV